MSEERELLNELDVIQDELWRLSQVRRDTESKIEFLEKQLDTARTDTVVAFGCELINEHESSFIGGENQIQAICQVVLDTITQK